MPNFLQLLLLTTILFTVGNVRAQYPPVTAVTQLSANNLHFLNSAVDSATIIGFGEATHGTAEFTGLAKELLTYLARHHDVRLLIIEDAFGAARRMNDYVTHQSPDPHLNESNWRYYTEEFVELLTSLRVYNKLNPSRTVGIIGPEMQYVYEDAGYLLEFFADKGVTVDLAVLTDSNTIWHRTTDAEVNIRTAAADRAKRVLDENAITWSGDEDYLIARCHLRVIYQYLETLALPESRRHVVREKYMLENIRWALDKHYSGAKAMFWAHNAHVEESDNLNGGAVSIGSLLRGTYGAAYFAILSDFGTGSFLAHPANAQEVGWGLRRMTFDRVVPQTYTYSLAEAGSPHAFVNLRFARANPSLTKFFARAQPMMGEAGAQFHGDTIHYRKFTGADGLIYVGRSSPITRLRPATDSLVLYREAFLAELEARMLGRDTINWPAIRERLREATAAASRISDLHPVLNQTLQSLNTHSFLIAPSSVGSMSGTDLGKGQLHPQLEYPMGKLQSEDVAYLNVPPIRFSHRPSLQAYADSLQQLIAWLDAKEPRGWVVDLRNNTGGNCWPMLAGLGPLLEEGVCGYFMSPNGKEELSWAYQAGASTLSGSIQLQTTDYQLRGPAPPIAVLIGGETASAGEVVATAFRAMPNVRSFGEPTHGLTTSNDNSVLADGAILLLTVSVYADRNRQPIGGKIEPDLRTNSEHEDSALLEATKWLRQMH